jgi:chemotaxis receptor (MCP) glutamine deamidase CheD
MTIRRDNTHHSLKTANSPAQIPHRTKYELAQLEDIKQVTIYAGDVTTSLEPVVLQTLLGSCVAVCLWDPVLRVGGMNHFLLPEGRLDPDNSRYGVNAMELLINSLMKLGCDRYRLVAKAFGGASVFASLTQRSTGEMNTAFVRKFLSDEGIPLAAQRLGGAHGVQVRFSTATGEVLVRSVDGSKLPKIIHDEAAYRHTHRKELTKSAEITLF